MDPTLTEASEIELLQRVLNREETAWNELFRRYRRLMLRCVFKVGTRCGRRLSDDDVNDIYAELCCSLVRDDSHKLRVYDPTRGARLSSWLGLLATNAAYDYMRHLMRQPPQDELDEAIAVPIDRPSALDQLLDRERYRNLDALLDAVTDKDRRFVELYYGDGLEPEEVALSMGISVKTVYSKKNKLRNKLISLRERVRRAA